MRPGGDTHFLLSKFFFNFLNHWTDYYLELAYNLKNGKFLLTGTIWALTGKKHFLQQKRVEYKMQLNLKI